VAFSRDQAIRQLRPLPQRRTYILATDASTQQGAPRGAMAQCVESLPTPSPAPPFSSIIHTEERRLRAALLTAGDIGVPLWIFWFIGDATFSPSWSLVRAYATSPAPLTNVELRYVLTRVPGVITPWGEGLQAVSPSNLLDLAARQATVFSSVPSTPLAGVRRGGKWMADLSNSILWWPAGTPANQPGSSTLLFGDSGRREAVLPPPSHLSDPPLFIETWLLTAARAASSMPPR
jgi:hypothetical protein